VAPEPPLGSRLAETPALWSVAHWVAAQGRPSPPRGRERPEPLLVVPQAVRPVQLQATRWAAEPLAKRQVPHWVQVPEAPWGERSASSDHTVHFSLRSCLLEHTVSRRRTRGCQSRTMHRIRRPVSAPSISAGKRRRPLQPALALLSQNRNEHPIAKLSESHPIAVWTRLAT